VAARTEFKREANPAREYLVVNWYEDPKGKVDIGTLYGDYKKYCQTNAFHPLSRTNFGGEVRACFPNVSRVRLTTQEDKERPYAYTGISCNMQGFYPGS
jgi:phage/plasmid-associated DNA primase